MTDYASAPAALPRFAPLDQTKHVKYTLGMVLGVDDFDQEFTYLSGRDRWLARDLSGYGTIWGLAVTVEVEERGPRINVAPGVAVTPCGHLVCVSPAQCAYVNDWLAAHEETARGLLASPPSSILSLYAVLCYRECLTDDLPIPGEPCRTEDTLTAPSRVKDDFRLELRTQAPPQPEEDAVRDLVAWLCQVPVVDGPGSTIDELLTAIRDAVTAAGAPTSPPSSPPDVSYDLVLGLPPPGLSIPADNVKEHLRVAFALWVSELRPKVRTALPGCECGRGCCYGACVGETSPYDEPCDDDVVLLAALDVEVVATADGTLEAVEGSWTVDETRRPYVLHTRFLQEWLLAQGLRPAEGSPPMSVPSGPPIASVTAHEVTGAPSASWDPATRVLDLGVPVGAGINDVKVDPLPAGEEPTVISFVDGVLTLGLAPGKAGPAGPAGAGITSVTVTGLPSGAAPTANLSGGVLALGIPTGPAGAGITSVTVTGLPSGAAPTASMSGGVLTLGIPAGQQGPRGADGIQFIVAAGVFDAGGNPSWSFNNLTAQRLSGALGFYYMTFDGFEQDSPYVYKGTIVIELREPGESPPMHTFEVVVGDGALILAEQEGLDPSGGFVVRAIADNMDAEVDGFMVEVSSYRRVV